MTDGPPTALPDGTGGPYLLQVVSDVADLKARVAQVERSVPELAARLDGRFAALEAQQARTQDHLAQQDQSQAAFRLEIKSQLGTLQSGQASLVAAEHARAEEARQAEAARKQQSAEAARAQEKRHAQAGVRFRATVAGTAVVAAGFAWSLLVRWPVRWQVFALTAGVALVLGWAVVDYVRSRSRP